jgi:transketolase
MSEATESRDYSQYEGAIAEFDPSITALISHIRNANELHAEIADKAVDVEAFVREFLADEKKVAEDAKVAQWAAEDAKAEAAIAKIAEQRKSAKAKVTAYVTDKFAPAPPEDWDEEATREKYLAKVRQARTTSNALFDVLMPQHPELIDLSADELEEAVSSVYDIPVLAAKNPSTRGHSKNVSEDRSAVRSWAKANGFEVGDRGRIPEAILTAYAARTK